MFLYCLGEFKVLLYYNISFLNTRLEIFLHEVVKLQEYQLFIKPSGQNRRKTVCRSVFLKISHCILSAELTKNALLQTVFWRFCPL